MFSIFFSHQCPGSNLDRGMWERCQWLGVRRWFSAGYSGFLHHLQLVGQDVARIWQKKVMMIKISNAHTFRNEHCVWMCCLSGRPVTNDIEGTHSEHSLFTKGCVDGFVFLRAHYVLSFWRVSVLVSSHISVLVPCSPVMQDPSSRRDGGSSSNAASSEFMV